MADETDDHTEQSEGEPGRPKRPQRPRLKAVPPKSRAKASAPPKGSAPRGAKPGTFKRGNKAARKNLHAELGTLRYVQTVMVDAIERARRKEYVVVESVDPKDNTKKIFVRRIKPMGPATLNALSNAARTLMEHFSQHEAGEEMRKVYGEVEELREIVIQLRQQAGVA